jgi:hypothetical protein
MVKSKEETILIQDGDTVIELTGADKDLFTTDRQNFIDAKALLEAEYKAKQDSRESAIKKLAEIAGLTKEEINAIL